MARLKKKTYSSSINPSSVRRVCDDVPISSVRLHCANCLCTQFNASLPSDSQLEGLLQNLPKYLDYASHGCRRGHTTGMKNALLVCAHGDSRGKKQVLQQPHYRITQTCHALAFQSAIYCAMRSKTPLPGGTSSFALSPPTAFHVPSNGLKRSSGLGPTSVVWALFL